MHQVFAHQGLEKLFVARRRVAVGMQEMQRLACPAVIDVRDHDPLIFAKILFYVQRSFPEYKPFPFQFQTDPAFLANIRVYSRMF
jgi:hypothetical protein